jgi:hypothetical protein
MTSQIDTLIGAFCAIVGPILGSRIAVSMAEATPIEIPTGIAQLIGPTGALIGLIIALKWMTGRLNKSEDKYEARQKVIEDRDEKRQKERDAMMHTLTELNIQTRDVIYQNSKAIEMFQGVIKDCPGKTNL